MCAISAYNDLSWVYESMCVYLIRFVCADFDSFQFQIDLLLCTHTRTHTHTLQVIGKVNTTIYFCCHFFSTIISSTSSMTFKVNIEKIEFQFLFIIVDDVHHFNSVFVLSLVNGLRLYILFDVWLKRHEMRCFADKTYRSIYILNDCVCLWLSRGSKRKFRFQVVYLFIWNEKKNY